MGFFSWLFPPRGGRRADRPIGTSLRTSRKSKAAIHKVYKHGKCPVNHRTHEAAERCANG